MLADIRKNDAETSQGFLQRNYLEPLIAFKEGFVSAYSELSQDYDTYEEYRQEYRRYAVGSAPRKAAVERMNTAMAGNPHIGWGTKLSAYLELPLDALNSVIGYNGTDELDTMAEWGAAILQVVYGVPFDMVIGGFLSTAQLGAEGIVFLVNRGIQQMTGICPEENSSVLGGYAATQGLISFFGSVKDLIFFDANQWSRLASHCSNYFDDDFSDKDKVAQLRSDLSFVVGAFMLVKGVRVTSNKVPKIELPPLKKRPNQPGRSKVPEARQEVETRKAHTTQVHTTHLPSRQARLLQKAEGLYNRACRTNYPFLIDKVKCAIARMETYDLPDNPLNQIAADLIDVESVINKIFENNRARSQL